MLSTVISPPATSMSVHLRVPSPLWRSPSTHTTPRSGSSSSSRVTPTRALDLESTRTKQRQRRARLRAALLSFCAARTHCPLPFLHPSSVVHRPSSTPLDLPCFFTTHFPPHLILAILRDTREIACLVVRVLCVACDEQFHVLEGVSLACDDVNHSVGFLAQPVTCVVSSQTLDNSTERYFALFFSLNRIRALEKNNIGRLSLLPSRHIETLLRKISVSSLDRC